MTGALHFQYHSLPCTSSPLRLQVSLPMTIPNSSELPGQDHADSANIEKHPLSPGSSQYFAVNSLEPQYRLLSFCLRWQVPSLPEC